MTLVIRHLFRAGYRDIAGPITSAPATTAAQQ